MPTDAQTTRWLALDDRALMAVRGPQALEFLQGQVTCDLRELEEGVSLWGAHCDPKGRMQINFRVLREDEQTLLLQVPTDMVPIARESLGKYILFFRAELEEASERPHLRGLMGPDAESLLGRHWRAPAAEPGRWLSDEWGILLTLADGRYEAWLTEAGARALDAALGQPEADRERWWLADIEAGWGWVRPTTRGRFTPQALNLPEIGGVSFRKGCYTGQEVVARLHYKGKLKQRLHRLSLAGDERPELRPGLPIQNAAGKKAGELVLAAATADNSQCLAVVDEAAAQSGDLLIDGAFPAQLQPIPYTEQ